MNPYTRSVPVLAACLAFIAFIAACSPPANPLAPSPAGDALASFTIPDDTDPGRHLIGFWSIDLRTGLTEPAVDRVACDHVNIAAALLSPEFEGALEVEVDPFLSAGALAPPAVKITATLNNLFKLKGWSVRGIVIDDTGALALLDPDGFTAQWDIGKTIPLNPYLNFSLENGSFPQGESIARTYAIESLTGQIPQSVWFAVDAVTEGPVESATEFSIAAVNGTFRWPGDSAPILCRIKDPNGVVDWVGAASKIFSGGPTFLTELGPSGDSEDWVGTLNYLGGLGGGYFPLYFGAHSPLDIPTLAATMIRVDPGPFSTGPANTGCSQRCYDPARTCRTKSSIVRPMNNFGVRPPASASGLAIADNCLIVRRIESNQSLAVQTPGKPTPEWTRLIPLSDLPTVPAVGNDGTVFFLEPEQGRLRALYSDGTDRWKHQFRCTTHADLILTSSPVGGLLITILREDGSDVALVGVGTDGHLKWQFDIASKPKGDDATPRIAVGPNAMLYYTLPTGGVLALDLSGNPKWGYSESGWTSSGDPVAGDDGRVFFLVNDGQMVACVRPSGIPMWTYPIQSDRRARFPSLGYDGNLFVAIETADDFIAYRQIDGNTGDLIRAVQAIGLRGYITHGVQGCAVYVQRDDPVGQTTCCDDFFTCRTYDGVLNWTLNTPGVTQIGAYPVVTPNGTIYVQGPDGMYVVML